MLQKHAFIINCARGGVIVEDDLLTALERGRAGGRRRSTSCAIEPPPPDGTRRALAQASQSARRRRISAARRVEALARIANELARGRHERAARRAGMRRRSTRRSPRRPEAETRAAVRRLAYRMGSFYPQFASDGARGFVRAALQGDLADDPTTRSYARFSRAAASHDRPARLDRQRAAIARRTRRERRNTARARPRPFAARAARDRRMHVGRRHVGPRQPAHRRDRRLRDRRDAERCDLDHAARRRAGHDRQSRHGARRSAGQHLDDAGLAHAMRRRRDDGARRRSPRGSTRRSPRCARCPASASFARSICSRELYIARHGETTWNLAGRYQGRLRVGALGTGVRQGFALAADVFARLERGEAMPERIGPSPMLRCARDGGFTVDEP